MYIKPNKQVKDGALYYFLREIYVARNGKWVLLPESELWSNEEMFGDFWTYDGIPWPCGDKFKYWRGLKIRSDAEVLNKLKSANVCQLHAIVHSGCTYIGGWAPW